MDGRDVTDGVTHNQEAIKAHEVETPAASVIQRSALCVSYLPLPVSVLNDQAIPKAKSKSDKGCDKSKQQFRLSLCCLLGSEARAVLTSPNMTSCYYLTSTYSE